jgi:alpha-amylase/alpha-mannosidase (GH57 family)
MSAEPRLKVVLCWHMHQPQYRDLLSGDYQLPWTYLHAIKDYIDMAAHLEAVPAARAVVNFAPILLEQIDDYTQQVQGFVREGIAIRDPLLAALVQPTLPATVEQRVTLIKACLRANEERLIARFAPYRRLADLAAHVLAHPDAMGYVRDQFIVDLMVWYHVAWLGETVRRQDARVRRLLEKESGFTLHDRRLLLEVIADQLGGVIPRYRALAETGRVELSTTPYAHPILPLLLDFTSAREAIPDARLPADDRYPGGEARARAHIERGIETFVRHFGFKPTGCWPAEGGVSVAALHLLEQAGFRWAASGETVLRNSLKKSGSEAQLCRHRPWRTSEGKIATFFRDDGLSDLIGFTYAGWHADDAVANLVHHLENIAHNCAADPNAVVSIILDGENAWEYYPENGYYFLRALYERLSSHPRIELTTFGECLKAGLQPRELPTLVAGSWVYGTFSTWIGDRDKNRGWNMLVDAKRAYDAALAAGELDAPRRRALAEEQLSVCEASDWFWWFGDYNPAAAVSDFEGLYRRHLTNLYQLLGREPLDYLAVPLSYGKGAPAHGGVMRPGQAPV